LGTQCWLPKVVPAGISGGPIERNGTIYVGDDAGAVWAFDAVSGNQPWGALPFTGCGEGADIKSFVLADRVAPAEDLYYATGAASGNALCAVTDDGTPNLKWAIDTIDIPGPSAPILVRIAGVAYLYVGSSDGQLYQIDPATGAITGSVLVRSGATIGAPAFDASDGMIYVGSDAGVVYAVQAPF
jgi:outer membrane protein assembly factor BamB